MRPKDKEKELLVIKVGLEVALELGYRFTTRKEISERSGISYSTVHSYLGETKDLQNAILIEGCKKLHPKIILEGILYGEEIAFKTFHENLEIIITYLKNIKKDK